MSLGIAFQNRQAVILGTVIDADNFVILGRQILIQQGIQTLANISFGVVDRNNQTEEHNGTPPAFPPVYRIRRKKARKQKPKRETPLGTNKIFCENTPPKQLPVLEVFSLERYLFIGNAINTRHYALYYFFSSIFSVTVLPFRTKE